MANRTFDDIVTDGMLKAGRDDLASVIEPRFNDWLQRQAKSWPWPSLTRKLTFSVPAGTLNFPMLLSGDYVATRFSRVLDECWLYTSDRSARGRIRVTQIDSAPFGAMDDFAGNTGLPTSGDISKDQPTGGLDSIFNMNFNVRTNRDYLLIAPCVIIPARITDGALYPWYPEDDTCLQAVVVETLAEVNGQDDSSVAAAFDVLSNMVSIDRVRHGVSNSQNNLHQLDKGVFR